MLDLLSVAGQLRRMRAELSGLADESGPRLASALGAWDAAAALGPALRDRVRRARTSWLVAEPLEDLGAKPIAAADPYRVVAADGSQVYPDRHELAQCFLVNVGLVAIDYSISKAKMRSIPAVAYLPEELYPLVGGIRQEADTRVVGARRFAAECDALTGSLEEQSLALIDGTLLLWWLEPDPDRLSALPPHDVKAQTLQSLATLLSAAKDKKALLGGYLSAPRSTDVVSMLKVVLCTEDPVDCDKCPYVSGKKTWSASNPGARLLPEPTKPCEEAETVSDAAVFSALLEPGQRSPRFRSAAKVASAYEAPVDFVYLHSGVEIARVEFPAWVTPDGLERLASRVLDQCNKGRGYPVSLAEAHEQAVVRAPERQAFIDLVRRGDAVPALSAKLARKRIGVL